MVDDKCSLSNPLLHHLCPFPLFQLLLQVSSSHLPVWLSNLLNVGFFSSCCSHLRLSLRCNLLSLHSLLLLCFASFLAFVFSALSCFSQSLISFFASRSVSFLLLFISTFSSHPFSLVPCLFRFSPKLSPYFDSFSLFFLILFSCTSPSLFHPLIPCLSPPLSRSAP